jgi:primosomal protein N' (replication factor Y)
MPLLRMDADTTSGKLAYDKMLEDFRAEKYRILLGTQMVAKGHDFPKVTLVGVMLADTSLFVSDFRASERTFSLITQVIGRAGRAEGGGVAVIQTLNPNNETIRLSAKQDYDAFYQNEIAVRRALVFPPFCDIAVFSFVAEEEDGLKKFAADFTAALHDAEKEGRKDVKLQIFGPFEAPIYKIKNKYRMRTVIKFKNNRAARTMFSELMFRFGKQSQGKIALAVDINPTNT